MYDERYIQNWFSYHTPTKDQTTIYETIRAHAREFAHIINNLVPAGQDKQNALERLRDAVMWANAAVATTAEEDRITADVYNEPVVPQSLHSAVDSLARARKSDTATPYQTATWPAPEAGLPIVPKSAPQAADPFVKRPAGKPIEDFVSEFLAGRK